MNEQLGKSLIIMGVIIAVTGIALYALPKITNMSKMPGDILIKKDNFVFYFPWVSSLIISAVLSLIFYLFFRNK